tara:strand:- start:2337 stop:2711 length:375 start_codon:yes stop_codon:yes gene_type:complete
MKDEIIAGLKNAIERGSSLDQAVQSFIGAGYNPSEVRQAASSLQSGTMNSLAPERKQKPSLPKKTREPPESPKQQQPQLSSSPIKKLSKKKLIIIILVSILLIIILGFVFLTIFGNQILDSLFG